MSLTILTYLVLVVPQAVVTLALLAAILMFVYGFVVGLIYILDEPDDTQKKGVKLLKKAPYKTVIALVVLATFMPTKEDAKIIAGVYIASEVASAAASIEGVSEIPKNLVRFINEKLLPEESKGE